MGFSLGDFKSTTHAMPLHWEGKATSIVLWNHDESTPLVRLDKANARQALDQLTLLVEMLENDAL